MQRENAVDNFRMGKTWVLIATDVIARGMDFKGVNCVINYDFPESAAAYIHRIGNVTHLAGTLCLTVLKLNDFASPWFLLSLVTTSVYFILLLLS